MSRSASSTRTALERAVVHYREALLNDHANSAEMYRRTAWNFGGLDDRVESALRNAAVQYNSSGTIGGANLEAISSLCSGALAGVPDAILTSLNLHTYREALRHNLAAIFIDAGLSNDNTAVQAIAKRLLSPLPEHFTQTLGVKIGAYKSVKPDDVVRKAGTLFELEEFVCRSFTDMDYGDLLKFKSALDAQAGKKLRS